ncbi:36940_t:CDS:2 [Gigaspora margarita]|uniref:36940_t:CDS:1 n=1 Tax=Gigaspora margarita TaxID=4874 RepID=A0ABN7V8S6_GIGMA|nr:36940_t:CDS:2 [Gigaspora margarita]
MNSATKFKYQNRQPLGPEVHNPDRFKMFLDEILLYLEFMRILAVKL